jgi:DNA-binding response OmpR family regulator
MKVLVIDDDRSLRYTLARILNEAGYEVVLAGEGEHGLALFRSDEPDLVLCDLNMPHLGGVETITQIRREAPVAKIIAMSGGATSMNADGLAEALEVGANEIMMKPFRAEELVSRVGDILAGR